MSLTVPLTLYCLAFVLQLVVNTSATEDLDWHSGYWLTTPTLVLTFFVDMKCKVGTTSLYGVGVSFSIWDCTKLREHDYESPLCGPALLR
jgi:hypothetical protein